MVATKEFAGGAYETDTHRNQKLQIDIDDKLMINICPQNEMAEFTNTLGGRQTSHRQGDYSITFAGQCLSGPG